MHGWIHLSRKCLQEMPLYLVFFKKKFKIKKKSTTCIGVTENDCLSCNLSLYRELDIIN